LLVAFLQLVWHRLTEHFMRWRVLMLVSLGVNAALAAAWLVSTRRSAPVSGPPAATVETAVKTNVVVRRQFFTWAEVESPDYPTYISNLREIGCPEQTIRDIIIAEVNALYAKRLATELVTPDQQWWRSEPDATILRVAAQKAKDLDTERRLLLGKLLGTNWESGDMVNLPRPSRQALKLDGPVLGVLPTEVKQAVEDISARSQDRLQAYLREAGTSPDPAQVAKLRQQTRDELAAILTPPQLEEYLLRYSQNAGSLRTELGQLKYFNATPDEFRAIFRATDAIDRQLQFLAGNTDPNSLLQRQALEQQRDNAIKLALGGDRYDQFTLLHDPIYQDAFTTAQKAGTPDAAMTIYQLNVATALQQASIRGNTNLTPEQMAIELKRVELEQLKASAQAMGLAPAPEEQPPIPPTVEVQLPDTRVRVRTHSVLLAIGDTVGSVAIRHGVSLNDIKAANPDIDFRKLRPGDVIQVPDALDLNAVRR
jgi:LysM domain